jgi:cytochrome c556
MPERLVKPLVVTLVFIAFSGVVGVASAAPRLKAIMHDWKADAASAEQMLASRGAYDPAEMGRILRTFIADSQDLGARASGAGAQAQDIKARFASFEANAKAALDAVSAEDQVRKRFAQMRGECRSCHDVYAN